VWLQASISVTRSLLAGTSGLPLASVARAVNQTADADFTLVLLPLGDRGRLMVEIAEGSGTEDCIGHTVALERSVSEAVLQQRSPLILADARAHRGSRGFRALARSVGLGSLMFLPLIDGTAVRGVLAVARRSGRAPFDHRDLDLATSFADQAVLALELADARARQRRTTLLEDRRSIETRLHDHVLQRLFAIGMSLEAIAVAAPPAMSGRLEHLLDATGETICQIRGVIYELQDLERGAAGQVIPDPDVLPA
jgi:GAF domain-containing protein